MWWLYNKNIDPHNNKKNCEVDVIHVFFSFLSSSIIFRNIGNRNYSSQSKSMCGKEYKPQHSYRWTDSSMYVGVEFHILQTNMALDMRG